MNNEDIKMNLNYYSGYFDAMFFADINSDTEGYSDELDFSSFNKEDLIKQFKELDDFFSETESILEESNYTHKQACHDFYFTRCGHGVGFWENDYCNESQGEKLTEIAKKYGEIYISVNNGVIYIG